MDGIIDHVRKILTRTLRAHIKHIINGKNVLLCENKRHI